MANLRKMAIPFRRKKQHDGRASEASDFLCNRLKICSMHLETKSTLRNHSMFLKMIEKKDTNSLSQKQKQIGLKILYFSQPISSSRVFKRFSRSIAFAWANHSY